MKRKNAGHDFSMCVQPLFLIGTYDENGAANFCPITWLSVTHDGSRYLLVISMWGAKKTRLNVQRTKKLSANLVSTSMLKLVDYLGSTSGHDGGKKALCYGTGEGAVVPVPTLNDSPWVYELEVVNEVICGESSTFFCAIRNVQLDERLDPAGEPGTDPGIDLTRLDPVIYSGHYHSVGSHLGTIGDYWTDEKNAAAQ